MFSIPLSIFVELSVVWTIVIGDHVLGVDGLEFIFFFDTMVAVILEEELTSDRADLAEK